MEQVEQERHFLVFEVDSYHFCGPADNVLGVIMPPPVTKMPLTSFHVAGTFLFRDHAALAIDLRRQLGLEEFGEKTGLFIVVQLESGIVGFRVDDVTDIVSSAELEPCHIRLPGLYHRFKQFAFLDENILLQTDFEMLFGADEVGDFLPGRRDFIASAPGEEAADTEESAEEDIEAVAGQDEREPLEVEGQDVSGTMLSTPEPEERKTVGSGETSNEKSGEEIKIPVDSGQGLNARRAEGLDLGRKVNHKQGLHARRPEPTKVFVRKEKKVTSPVAFPHGKISQGTFGPSHAPLIRQVEPSPLCSSVLGSDVSGYEDPGIAAWWRFAVPGVIIAVLVLIVMVVWPEDGRQVGKVGKIKMVTREVSVPVKRDITLKSEDKVAVVKEEALVEDEPETPVVESSPIPSLESATELLRVETNDFTLTIESPPAIERQATLAAVQIVAQESVMVNDIGITHVVVKNDTLWDIAMKYLGNPLKYAELARLSRIKDPHWIYPGNIIRIIRKSAVKE